MLVDELRVSIPAQENTKIIEPSYNALEFHAVHEKNGQWCLVLANMIEKSVLKALRALCRHGLPRPFGHAYAVERGPENHPARAPPRHQTRLTGNSASRLIIQNLDEPAKPVTSAPRPNARPELFHWN